MIRRIFIKDDDVESLVKILKGLNPPTTVHFERFANILISVGQRSSSSDRIYSYRHRTGGSFQFVNSLLS